MHRNSLNINKIPCLSLLSTNIRKPLYWTFSLVIVLGVSVRLLVNSKFQIIRICLENFLACNAFIPAKVLNGLWLGLGKESPQKVLET